jgi:hypothetical protein
LDCKKLRKHFYAERAPLQGRVYGAKGVLNRTAADSHASNVHQVMKNPDSRHNAKAGSIPKSPLARQLPTREKRNDEVFKYESVNSPTAEQKVRRIDRGSAAINRCR